MSDSALIEEKNEKSGKSKRRKGSWLVFLLALVFFLVVIVSAAGAGLFFFAKYEFEKSGPVKTVQQEETVITIPKGVGVSTIASQLEDQGLISNAILFRLGVKYHEAEQSLKAGEYAIPAQASMFEIMDILREGKSILYKLTVPEGLTSAQIMRLVEAHDMLVGDMPEVLPDEGSLLPETYLFQRGMQRTELIAQMGSDAQKIIEELWSSRAENLPFDTKEEAINLASIVEKETAVADERPRVAAVFVNRLKRGMRLESDPTIIYGLTGGEPLGRGLRRSELDKPNKYNTYQIDGLPPTPIANPGRASIAAVLNPAVTKDLYFVADGTGGHAFATSYREHQRNVAAWRRIERERRAAN